MAARHRLLDCLVADRAILIKDATRILGARDRAEDVLQDAALRCLESAALGPGIGSPRGMLRRIVRNLALDQLRRHGREPTAPLSPDAACERPCAERSVADRQALARVAAGMARLPPLHREILIDHRLNATRQKRIAERVGLSPSRVHAIINRAHDTLINCADLLA